MSRNSPTPNMTAGTRNHELLTGRKAKEQTMSIALAIFGNIAIVIGVNAAIIYAMTRNW